MNRNFKRVMPHVFRHEGGYVDHPSDPGGATNLGITLATLSAWRGRRVTKAEVRRLSEAEARQIYRRQYWAPISGDDLPGGVDYAVFDFAVNSGPRRASDYLQRIAGVERDGVIGVRTLAAVRAMDHAEVVGMLCAARLAYMKRIRHRQTKRRLWPAFGKGWQRRVDEVEALALRLAAESAARRRSAAPPGRPAVPDTLTAIGRALAAFFFSIFKRRQT